MRYYREDTKDFTDMLKDTGEAAKEFAESVVLLLTRLACLPILLAIKLWLPQLPESERVRRDIARREWADEDC